jgi:hypothetical protein
MLRIVRSKHHQHHHCRGRRCRRRGRHHFPLKGQHKLFSCYNYTENFAILSDVFKKCTCFSLIF